MMKTTRLGIFRFLSTIVFTLLIGGCGARTIVDESGKPLAGVHVVATYWGEGMYLAGTRVSCFRVEALVTGAEGSFDFPFFSGNFNPMVPKRTRDIGYFKAGYELVPNQTDFVDPVKMRQFSGIAKQRFDSWNGEYKVYNHQSGCPDLEKKLFPLLVAIHAEAKQIAKTYEERLRVLEYESLLEICRSADEKLASKNYTEGRLQLRKEMGLQGYGY